MLFSGFKKISRAVEHLHRYRIIVGIFLKYGFGDLAHRIPWPASLKLRVQKTDDPHVTAVSLSPPERLRKAFEELGPTFVKFGQLLSSRTHLLSPAFTLELAKLLDQVPPIPFSEVRTVVERELGRPLNESFSSFEETPLGSASIAQVHRAVLPSGEQVVVKVRRPGIEHTIRVDLEIMAHVAALLENHLEGWRVHRPTAVVAEFARRMEQELDFAAEAAHIERFANQFSGNQMICVPKVYHASSTRCVLTMEYVDGVKVSKLEERNILAADRQEIANRIATLVMRQIFEYGFFHADPHPGNIHILPNNVICFLDFGMMGFLDRNTREWFADLVIGITQREEAVVSAALLKLAGAELEGARPGLEADVSEFIHQHFYRPMGEMVFAELVNHLFKLTTRHELTMPSDLFIMLKALSLMEGLVRELNPGHDLIAQAKPFMQELHLKRASPKRILRQWMEVGMDALVLARELPLEIRRVLSQLKNGRLKLTFHHEGLESLETTLERVSNRLSFAMVLSALVVGSSIIIHARVPPQWHGMPVIGLVGYVFAGLMGVWLLLAILRHGKM